MLFSSVLLAFALPALALPHTEHSDCLDKRNGILPGRWYHKRDHPVSRLFRRQEDDTLPEVGSPEWAARYPVGDPYVNIPPAWITALNAAVAANLIPAIAPGGGGPDMASGCDSAMQCRHPDDIWDGPDGMIGLSVDDGPGRLPDASPRLYDFLAEQDQKVTHFMIGQNILGNPDLFLRAFEELGNDIAVHTWSHPRMTSLTNEQILAQLGWTLQIIHDSTEGRIPRYWRPPYGQADNRVRAIAREIFGLTTVIWNADTNDWGLAAGATTLPGIQAQFQTWLDGPKSPGLIVLEHEISGLDVQAFINAYPLLKSYMDRNEWEVVSVAQMFDEGWYLNSMDNESPVVDMDVGRPVAPAPVPPAIGNTSTPPRPSNTSSTHHSTTTHGSEHQNSGSVATLPNHVAGFVLTAMAVVLGSVVAL